MEATEKLNKIYSLYTQGNYTEAKKYNDEILWLDANNIYAKRYQNLLTQKIKSQVEPKRKGPIPTVKWKSLKCPHCVAKISLSWLTQWQKDRIRNKDLNNLEIKCPYCHTKFMLQNKKVKPILWIKLWDKINYKQKAYRTTGYIEYQWNWYEGNYSGKVYYIEWILLWSDNSYLYFSEWYSVDDGKKVYEFDFSQKNIPKNPMNVDFSKKTFSSSGILKKMKEYSKVKVKSAYWENAKSFKIWEEVTLAPDTSSWCVYEQESSGTQIEVWIYKTEKVSENLARKIFKKAAKKENYFQTSSFWLVGWKKVLWTGVFGVLIGFILLIVLPPYKTQVKNFEIWKNYYISGEHEKYLWTKTCSDEGETWTCYKYKKSIWLSFSIQDEKDLEIIEKIKSRDISDERLKEITSGKQYSFMWDYMNYNGIYWGWIYLFILAIFMVGILYSKNND